MAASPDVAIVGAGIVGCAVAAFLAEAGTLVEVVEREAIAAGASGRNSGIVQHPMDSALVALHEETVEHYRELEPHGFRLPEPGGIIVVGEDPDGLRPGYEALRAAFPELAPQWLGPGEAAALEPALSPATAGYRLATGRAVPPAAATRAFAARARAAGARFRAGDVTDPAELRAGVVVIAAGAWTPALVDPTGGWRPIAPLWGVNVEVWLAAPPRHALEEAGVEELIERGGDVPSIFSLVTAAGATSLGSTFLPEEPDAAALAPALRARGARFVPALQEAPIRSVRACARPLSADGRPLLGRAPGRERVFVAAGHGPWGISLGAASARLVADLVLGRVAAPPPAFDPARFGAP